jgi:hypothetical protein
MIPMKRIPETIKDKKLFAKESGCKLHLVQGKKQIKGEEAIIYI